MEPAETLRITLVQSALNPAGTEATLFDLEEELSQLSSPTDLIVLPEMFATGYTMEAEKYAQNSGLGIFRWMHQMANRHNAAVCGSLALKENGQYFNRLIWMRPDGNFETYNKKHLFAFAGEDKVYTPGQTRLITEWKGWRICPLICYDLRFPVWSFNEGYAYDLLIYVAAWPDVRINAWSRLLPARAIENQCYTVGVNSCAKFEVIQYGGNSVVIGAKGNEIIHAGTEPGILQVEVNYLELVKFRDRFPVLK